MTVHLKEIYFVEAVFVLFYVGVSVSAVISSMGFGEGVVAMVQPIHAPTAIMATNAMVTGVAISQNWTSAVVPRFRKEMM